MGCSLIQSKRSMIPSQDIGDLRLPASEKTMLLSVDHVAIAVGQSMKKNPELKQLLEPVRLDGSPRLPQRAISCTRYTTPEIGEPIFDIRDVAAPMLVQSCKSSPRRVERHPVFSLARLQEMYRHLDLGNDGWSSAIGRGLLDKGIG